MRLVLFAAMVGLAACATVEERTDRNAGTGLTQGSMGATGDATLSQGQSVEVAMTAPDRVPQFAITEPGATGNKTEAARLAAEYDAEPMGVGVTLGGALYWLRQVRANSVEFAVAEPQSAPSSIDGTAALNTEAAARINCLLTGETWTFDGVLVAGLDCS